METDPKFAGTSLYSAYRKLGGPLFKAVDDLKTYPTSVPTDFSFASGDKLDYEMTEKEKKHTSLTIEEQFKLVFECFSLVAKGSYYGNTSNLSSLPLTHALVAYPLMCREDELNWKHLPDRAAKVAYRLYPEELLQGDKDGNLPLHVASAHRDPMNEEGPWRREWMDGDDLSIERAIQCSHLGLSYVLSPFLGMAKEYPSVFMLEVDGYDCHNQSLVKQLVEACPKAAMVTNDRGELPLHAAIRARKGTDVVDAIIEAYPEALRAITSAGDTCLHLVAQQCPGSINLREKVADFVVEHGELPFYSDNFYGYSDDRHIDSDDEDDDGGLLLMKYEHICNGEHLISEEKHNLITRLVRAYPEACSMRNNEGKLPFHYFLKNKAQNHFNNVNLFMTEETSSLTDNSTGLLGFQMAATMDDLELTFLMLQAYPSALEHFVVK